MTREQGQKQRQQQGGQRRSFCHASLDQGRKSKSLLNKDKSGSGGDASRSFDQPFANPILIEVHHDTKSGKNHLELPRCDRGEE